VIDWRALWKAVAVALGAPALVVLIAVTMATVEHFFGLAGLGGVAFAVYLVLAVSGFYRIYKRD
jgi:hypothetical protein